MGSSHGSLVGVIIDGVPAGIKIVEPPIQEALDSRRPGQSAVTTDRKEKDRLVFETGLFDGKTTGEPIVAYIRNTDVDSSYYEEIRQTPRPGHADYPAHVKFKGSNDFRGGGRFSGRLTAGIVIAGSIAKQILLQKEIEILAYTTKIGPITVEDKTNVSRDIIYDKENLVRAPDLSIAKQMTAIITNAKTEGDSVGGIVECQITNLPIGVGEPWFDSIESKISHLIFSIPAVKGIEFGSGFKAPNMKGSEHNDPYETKDGKIITTTNNAGGILGGLSNGMPVVFRVAFKPTSSIKKQQSTVNRNTGESETLKVRGRHDPCIVPRAVPVVEAAAACVLLDLLLAGDFITR